jgi:hypothetical protein
VKLVPLKGVPAVVRAGCNLYVYEFIYMWFIDKAFSISKIALNSRIINE